MKIEITESEALDLVSICSDYEDITRERALWCSSPDEEENMWDYAKEIRALKEKIGDQIP